MFGSFFWKSFSINALSDGGFLEHKIQFEVSISLAFLELQESHFGEFFSVEYA